MGKVPTYSINLKNVNIGSFDLHRNYEWHPQILLPIHIPHTTRAYYLPIHMMDSPRRVSVKAEERNGPQNRTLPILLV